MSVGIAAASSFFLVLAPASVGAQDQGAVFGAGTLAVVEGTLKSVGGITVPLPCPPETECVDPWADQYPTDLGRSSDGIGGLYGLETLLQGGAGGAQGNWSSTGSGSMASGGY